jgi:peptide/nickel transport system substrate-binding protein
MGMFRPRARPFAGPSVGAVLRMCCIALLMVLIVTTTHPAGAAPTTRGRVVIGIRTEDVSLDPNATVAVDWLNVLLNMYDTLVTRNRRGVLEGMLAESYRAVSTTVWELTLRQDVKWHDGTSFTAEDVKFTLERVLNPQTRSQQRTYVAEIKSVEIINPFRVRITTERPDPLLIDKLQLVPVVSARYVQGRGDTALANRPMGTGPFKFVEWNKGGFLAMTAHLGYWQGAPKSGTVLFRTVPEDGALLAALQTGEIDIAVNLSPDLAVRFRNAPNFTIKGAPSQRSIFLVLDPAFEPLKNQKVRQALNLAVDKEGLVRNILLGFAEPIPSMVGSMYAGYNDRLKPYPFDPDRARQLLREAGHPDGFALTLHAPNGRYLKDKDVALAIGEMFRRVGVRTDVNIMEWGTMLNRYRAHQLSPAYMIGFGTPIWDFSLPFNSYLLPENAQAYWRDPTLATRVREATAVVDRQRRETLLRQINEHVYQEAPFVFLYLQQAIYGISSRIDWEPRVDERVWLFEVGTR